MTRKIRKKPQQSVAFWWWRASTRTQARFVRSIESSCCERNTNCGSSSTNRCRFGTVGEHGKGLTEMLNIDKTEVDLICGSLEASVESVGGFCVGTHFIVEHQRLSGLGYCFSASQPPFLTQAAISALDLFEKDPSIFEQLRQVATKVDEKFKQLTRLQLGGDHISPVKHLYVKDEKSDAEAEEMLRKISDQVSWRFDSGRFSLLNLFNRSTVH